jgi:hypothetical protein
MLWADGRLKQDNLNPDWRMRLRQNYIQLYLLYKYYHILSHLNDSIAKKESIQVRESKKAVSVLLQRRSVASGEESSLKKEFVTLRDRYRRWRRIEVFCGEVLSRS